MKKSKVLKIINKGIEDLEAMEYKVVMFDTKESDQKEKHEIVKSLNKIQGGLVALRAIKRKFE